MIQLRNTEPALRRGNYITLPSNSTSAFTFLRQYNNETILVVSNLSNTTLNNIEINLSPGTLSAGTYQLKDLLTVATQNIVITTDAGAVIQNIGNLDARTTAIYKVIGSTSGLTGTESNSFHLFPIPANDYIFIHPDDQMGKNMSVTISDMFGRVLKHEQITGQTSMSVKNLLSGFYVVKVTDGINTRSGKILIER